MNIDGIRTNRIIPASLGPPGEHNPKIDAGKAFVPDSSAPVLPEPSAPTRDTQSPIIKTQTLVSRIDYIKAQLDKILVNFPPFFPPGSYQRVDLIKGIRAIQDEVEQSSAQIDLNVETTSPRLSENATDYDISIALDELLSIRDALTKSIPMTSESVQPGSLVSIKV